MRWILVVLAVGCDDRKAQLDPPDAGPGEVTAECPLPAVDSAETAEVAIAELYACLGHPAPEVSCTKPTTRWLCGGEIEADRHVIGLDEVDCIAQVTDRPDLATRRTLIVSRHTLPRRPAANPRDTRVLGCGDQPECSNSLASRFGPRNGVLTVEQAVADRERGLQCCGLDPAEFEIACWGPAACYWEAMETVEGIQAVGEELILCRVFDAARGAGLLWSLYPVAAIRP